MRRNSDGLGVRGLIDRTHEPLSVTAVIPAYNSAKTLPRAIESVIRQTVRPRLIVVDDGSTDGTPELLKSYEGNITVIRQANSGTGAARAAGTHAANTDLIAYLDADDAWHPNKIQKQLTVFSDPEIGLSSTAGQWIDESGSIIRVSKPRAYGYLTRELLFRNFIVTSSVVVRKRAIERLRPMFKPELFPVEDWESWIRLSTFTKISVSPEVLVDYYVLSNSGTRTRSPEDFKRLYEQVYEGLRTEPSLRHIMQLEGKRVRGNLHFMIAYLNYEDGNYRGFWKELFQSVRLAPLTHPWLNTLPMLLLPRAAREQVRRLYARIRRSRVASDLATGLIR
jgi:glycosyltransferase involved in cell wall biosynthesis